VTSAWSDAVLTLNYTDAIWWKGRNIN